MDHRETSNKQQPKRSVRFNRALWLSLLLIGACWVFLYAFLGHYSEADKVLYDKMVNRESQQKLSETQVSKQDRKGLQKSFFIDLGKGRQELNVQSARSELALEKTGRHVEIVEHLYDMTAWMQESLYDILPDGRKVAPGLSEDGVSDVIKEQVILQIHAREAIYHYKDGQFTAENFTLKRYIIPNHNPDGNVQGGKLIAEATAEALKTTLVNQGIEMKVDGLDLKLSLSQDELSTAESCIAISADHASYQGNRLMLEEHAVVVYGKSTLSARLIALTTNKFEPSNIQNMIADGNVELEDYAGINAASDRAVFTRVESQSKIDSKFPPGMITLSMYTPDYSCHITDKEGDHIWASCVMIDTISGDTLFTAPYGTIQTSAEAPREIYFSSDKMKWNEDTMKLTFSGNVKIDDPAIGRLQAANDVNIVLIKVNEKKILKGMETDGEAILNDFDNGASLKSYGPFRVNHQAMEVKILSPQNPDGSVPKGKQVYFADSKGTIYADKVFMKYHELSKKIVPERIVMKDNVKIANVFDPSSKNKAPVNQHILADRVDLIPLTHQMILKASKGRRVLFFDKENNLEVSAPGLEIYRDKAAQKDTIQGIGDVRFSFVEDELNQFRRHFLLKSGK